MDIFDLQASEDEVEARNDSTEIILEELKYSMIIYIYILVKITEVPCRITIH